MKRNICSFLYMFVRAHWKYVRFMLW